MAGDSGGRMGCADWEERRRDAIPVVIPATGAVAEFLRIAKRFTDRKRN